MEEIDDALLALRDGVDVAPLITHRFPLDRAAEALSVAAELAAGSSKVLLRLSDRWDSAPT
ncbi:hypothetical protein KBZ94_32295 [Streptomyces sp. RM72]|uniref:hypothetical protein n=1 Tax=Streptomyces sp. RM72 TaxID=1115510 RepID=UPI001B383763|nr:hypothetical protein [Streptomyces sp. RM72]MBQ0889549.1 hypothetical protein [Streptomyces sp. RM72]